MIISSFKPLIVVAISALTCVFILLSRKKPNLREFWSILAGVVNFLIVVSMIPDILSGNTLEVVLMRFYPGLSITLRVDSLGLMFALTASFLWILTTIYSIGYMRAANEHAQTRYYACFAGAISATMGAAFSGNLLTLYLFYEIITMVTYPLVSHKETPEALAGGKKYITYLLGTSKAFLLPAVVLTYVIAGTLEFSTKGILHGGDPLLLTVVYALFIAGFAKAAIMPFHNWLPSAMVAPTPVSALLHAVAVVKVGVFSIIRVVIFIFGVNSMGALGLGLPLAYIACFTIVTASIIALTKDNLKARLAYSTISQLSYIILGAALLTPSSMVGGIIHISNHAFSKITLFFCAGSIYCAAHKTKISELSGIGKKMPWTMTAFFIASLSMIGVPPAGGFISKWYIALGSIEAKEIPILAVIIASSILNAAYFLPITYKAFFEKPDDAHHHDDHGHSQVENSGDKHEEIKEIPMVAIPLMVTAIISILIGIYPGYFLTLAKEVIR